MSQRGLDALLEGVNPDRASRARAYIAVHQDAARWRKLVALARANSIRAGLGGGLYVCSAEANEHDAAWASVQAVDHNNPHNTIWISEGCTLDEAIDKADVDRAERMPIQCAECEFIANDGEAWRIHVLNTEHWKAFA